jgi:glycosyltransferase involved in cell wall biosynthesis
MGVPATLDLVGDGPKRKELESLARELGIGPYVRFHGMVEPGPRLWECFDRADVFVLSSTSEGTPKVILEAMARGVPVFASAVGGVPDVVEDGRTGFLFDCLDLEQAVGRLAQLAKSPEALARVADEARIVAERQTVEAQAEITVRALADEMRRR